MKSRRLPAEAWLALALSGTGGFFATYLWLNPAGAPIFGVSPNTLPLGMAAIIAVLGLVMLVQVVRRAPREGVVPAPGWRMPALVALCAAYSAALPWAGYLLASGLFVGSVAWLFGARRRTVLAGLVLLAPLAIAQFFERAMVIYLPAGRLF